MIVSLGQTDTITSQKMTGYRPMALQYAVTAVLTQAPDLEPFPGKQVIIQAERFAALVTQIVQTANQPGWATSPGYTWTPIFTTEQAAINLKRRGYEALDTSAVIPTPTAIVSPAPYTTPTPAVVIEPVPRPVPEPYSPKLPDVYDRPPAPVEIAPALLKQESVLKEEKEVDSNTILWIMGAVVGGLILGGMTKQRGGRYDKIY